jgi:hypothetical protein
MQVRVTIAAEGAPEPAGSADYVTESIAPDGSKVRHYVCRSCLEVIDAPEGEHTVHDCPESES